MKISWYKQDKRGNLGKRGQKLAWLKEKEKAAGQRWRKLTIPVQDEGIDARKRLDPNRNSCTLNGKSEHFQQRCLNGELSFKRPWQDMAGPATIHPLLCVSSDGLQ